MLRRTFLLLLALAAACPSGPARADAQERLSFLVIGDWGKQGNRPQKRVAAAMDALAARIHVDFIVSTGDNFYPAGVKSPDDPHWRKTFEEVYDLPHLKSLPWYVSLGNHDYLGDVRAEIAYGKTHSRWRLPAPYYSHSFSSASPLAQLFFLDTNAFIAYYRARPDRYNRIDAADTGGQLNWLRRQLRESRAVWKIVIGHHPVYSSGFHGDTRELKTLLPPLFRQFGVQAYFSGHDHDLEYYRPPGGTAYIVSGGGSGHRWIWSRRAGRFTAATSGFVHVALDRDSMTVRFFDEKGRELYRRIIKPD
ncbi:MAG: tartrate-resistant acid phosphatase type 5 family protein [Gammaproteobacteria bacterium]|jgi:tartrate-resistant acid phosphatase type 5